MHRTYKFDSHKKCNKSYTYLQGSALAFQLLWKGSGNLVCSTCQFSWNKHSPFHPSITCSVASNSLWPHVLFPDWFLCLWNSPGTKTRVGYHFFLQQIFLIQGDWTCISCIAGGFFNTYAIREACKHSYRGQFQLFNIKLLNWTEEPGGLQPNESQRAAKHALLRYSREWPKTNKYK